MSWKTGVSILAIVVFLEVQLLSADRPAKRPRIWGIAHVTILSTDIPAAYAFYMTLLGGGAKTCAWCEKIPSDVFIVNPIQSISVSRAPSPAPEDLLGSVTFGTDNVPELRRYFVAQKIECSPPVTQKGRGTDRVVSVVDPEGHHILFVQEDGSPQNTVQGRAMPGLLNDVRIIHAGFVVRDRAAEEHFFKDILGFRPYWHGGMNDDQTDWVSLQVPNGTDWLEFMVNVSPNADHHTLGVMNHFALGVQDIHAAQKRLLANGAKLTEEPKLGRDGKWQLNLYDPDDTRIEFMEFTPREKPCCSEFAGPHPGPKQ
jgi:catechol 2,3-dioxygenase-like lactoylglutathione lyase family enzyme